MSVTRFPEHIARRRKASLGEGKVLQLGGAPAEPEKISPAPDTAPQLPVPVDRMNPLWFLPPDEPLIDYSKFGKALPPPGERPKPAYEPLADVVRRAIEQLRFDADQIKQALEIVRRDSMGNSDAIPILAARYDSIMTAISGMAGSSVG